MLKNFFSVMVAIIGLAQAGRAQMIMRPGEAVKLDTNVNSQYEELLPLLSPDRKTLYFVRTFHPMNTGGKDGGQDIWYSTLQSDGSWSRPFNLGVPINNETNNALAGISEDGNTLYLTNVYKNKGKMEPGISFTKKENGVWSAPKALEIADLNIQRGYIGGWMCKDEKTLFLTMKSDDAVGREDIYVTTKNGDTWSKPINLGKSINTVGFETSPFYVEADSMLYFASNGHGGAGDADIFRAKRLDDSWNHWSKPQNMGPQVNGDGFDAYLSIAYDSTAFFVKEDPEVRHPDIYTVILRDPARKAKEDSAAEALARAAKNKKSQDDKTKKAREGTDDDDRDPSEIQKELTNRIRLINNEFESILFDFGSSKLRPEGKRILDRAVKYLKDHPSQGIELVGFTDSVDTEIKNLILSDKRSYSAKEYLMRKGVSRNRILTHGFGKQIYAAENASARGRQKNRRVEMNVLIKPDEFRQYYQTIKADQPEGLLEKKTTVEEKTETVPAPAEAPKQEMTPAPAPEQKAAPAPKSKSAPSKKPAAKKPAPGKK